MPEIQTKWLVMFPFFNAETDDAFSTFFVTAPCSEEEMAQFLGQVQAKENEHRLLAVLREHGCANDLEEVDEASSHPLTDSGYIPGSPSYVAIPDLEGDPGVKPSLSA